MLPKNLHRRFYLVMENPVESCLLKIFQTTCDHEYCTLLKNREQFNYFKKEFDPKSIFLFLQKDLIYN